MLTLRTPPGTRPIFLGMTLSYWDPAAGAREKVAARLVRGEKAILCHALDQIDLLPRSPDSGAAAEAGAPDCAVELSELRQALCTTTGCCTVLSALHEPVHLCC